MNLQVGDEIDFYRDQANKDTSGWFGPARLSDVSKATRGVVQAQWKGDTLNIQLANLRKTMHFLVYLSAYLGQNLPQNNTFQHLTAMLDKMTTGTDVIIGMVRVGDTF